MKFVMIFVIIATVLSGCSSEKVPKNALWDRNPTEHWINGEEGEKLHLGEHELDEEGFCAVCKSVVEIWTDGGADICNYDEKNSLIRSSTYFPDGSLVWDYVTEYKYGKNDEIIYSATYQNGRLYETYECIEETVQQDYYEEDGSHQVSITYPGYLGNTTINQWYAYDPDGNLHYESCIEKIIDGEGNARILTENTADYKKGVKTYGEYDEKNDPVFRKEYDLDGNLLALYEFFFEYDEKGCLVYEKQLIDGKPVFEIFFDVVGEEDLFYSIEKKNISYGEDGSRTIYILDENGNIDIESREEFSFTADGKHYLTTVTEIYHFSEIKQITEYNANGDEISCKSYNFADELLSTYDYAYEYGEGNCVVYRKILFDGKLYQEDFYNIVSGENGFESRLAKRICYETDGSYFIYEYDENESEISAVRYDPSGNIIEN